MEQTSFWDEAPPKKNQCPSCGVMNALVEEVVISKVVRTILRCMFCQKSGLKDRWEPMSPSARK